jgi:hypothetical protein
MAGYQYSAERPGLFTEEGQVRFIRIRDKVNGLLRSAGAFRLQELGAVSWEEIACVDRMVELGELAEWPRDCWGQYRVFSTPQVHNR